MLAKKTKSSSSLQIAPLLKFIKPYWLYVFAIVVCAFGHALIGISIGHVIQLLINAAVNDDLGALSFAGIVAILVIVVGMLVNYGDAFCRGKFATHTVRDIRNALTKQILVSPRVIRQNDHSGDLITTTNGDVAIVDDFFNNTLGEIIYRPLVSLFSFMYLLTINWKLLLVCCIILPFALYLIKVIGKPLQHYAELTQQSMERINSLAIESISGNPIIKSFRLFGYFSQKYNQSNQETVNLRIKAEYRNSFMIPIQTLLYTLPFVVCVGYGGKLALGGEISSGGLVAFVFLLNFLITPLSGMPELIAKYKATMASVGRIFGLLNGEKESTDGKARPETYEGPVAQISGVSFRYNEQIVVLENINLSLEAGKHTALVGMTGSGKSSIVNLLCGFYQTQAGEIKLFGQDVNDWSIEELRKTMAVVSQETYLFPGSIKENIRVGNPEATDDEVQSAAIMAYAHTFISELQNGYDTVIGERGASLSGGQIQRIAIARAILKDAPILILDEATSALDNESQSQVQAAIENARGNRALLTITHRLNTVVNADNIVMLSRGNIVGEGTHSELMETNQYYRDLLLTQMKESEKEGAL